MTLEQKKLHMAKRIGAHIWEDTTDEAKLAANGGSSPGIDLGGDRVRLSQLTEGVCRHKSLIFQVLAQAVGIKSILVKGRLNGERHAANMIRVNGQWYIYDVANPVYRLRADGSRDLRARKIPVDGPPPANGRRDYKVRDPDTQKAVHYDLCSEMFWRIGRFIR